MHNTISRYFHSQRGLVAIKQGFSWPAFFFGSLWAIANGMWIRAVPMLLFDVTLWIATGYAAAQQVDSLAFLGLAALLVCALVRGRRGHRWLDALLQRRGYVLLAPDHESTQLGRRVTTQRQEFQRLPTDELLRLCGEVGHGARLDLLEELQSRGVAIPSVADATASKPDEFLHAAPFTRLMAFAVDLAFLMVVEFAVLLVVTSLVDRPTSGVVLHALNWPVFCGYWLLRDTVGGRSVGKRVFRLAVHDRSDQARCSLRQAVLRNIPLFIPLDWLFVLVDGRSRYGDKLANTMVVELPRMVDQSR